MEEYRPAGVSSLESNARLVLVAVVAYIVAQAIKLGFLVRVGLAPFSDAEEIGNFIDVGAIGSYGLSVIMVALWIYRAHDNLRDFGADGLEFTPGWSVGWFFVPFMSLFKPFQAMKELWNASEGTHSDFRSHAPPVLSIWWGAFIIDNMLSNIGSRYTAISRSGAILTMIAATIAGVVSAIYLLKIVRHVTAAQGSYLHTAEVFA
jgi:hypothetical protein